MGKANFHPDHLADLRKSGLIDKTIAMMGVRSLRPADIQKALGYDPKSVKSVLAFPYPGADEFFRYKVFPSIKDKEGHAVKYLQKQDTGAHFYILKPVEAVLQNSSVPLAIAEGEKKTAALIQSGVMAIGIGGVWGWRDGETHTAIQEFDQITWVDRDVQLYCDSDIWHRRDLLKAVYALSKEIESRGATVKVAVIGQSGKNKTGIDDFLVANGSKALAGLKMIPISHKAFSQSSKWWKEWTGKEGRKGINQTTADRKDTDLKDSIQYIRKTPQRILHGFEKKQMIAAETLSYIKNNGALYNTPEEHGYFFDKGSGALHPLEGDAFLRYLSDTTGLNPTETEFKYLLEQVQTETKRHSTKTAVFHLSHYDGASHKLYVSDFQGGMWLMDGGSVVHAPNGRDGVLFVSSPLSIPFRYLPASERIKDVNLNSFLATINGDPQSSISPDELRLLFYIWFLSIFFQELNPTKIIPTLIGPQGATKTTTARKFGIQLVGEHFNVTHLETSDRGEQAFIATVCGRPFVVFDNADAPVRWLPDRLATFATGHEFELRKLYTTNELGIYKPTAHIMLTSRDPYFRRPDVAERLLIAKLVRPAELIPESEVEIDIIRCRDTVWSDTLDILNRVLTALKDITSAPRTGFRMADFASFGWRLCKAKGGDTEAGKFYDSLKKLEQEQSLYTVEEDSVTTCLGFWLSDDINLDLEIDTGTLYKELLDIAKREGLMLPKTAATFGKRLRQAKKAIEMTLGVKISVFVTSHTSRWLFSKTGSNTLEKFPENALPTQPAPDEPAFSEAEEVQDGKKTESF